MKRSLVVSIALAAALAGYFYWASDERRIRRLLDRVSDAVSKDGAGGIVDLAAASGLGSYLAIDVTVDPGRPVRALTGAQDVAAAVGRLQTVMAAVRFELTDVDVLVDDGSASVQAMARLALRDRAGNEELYERRVIATLVQRDGDWVIATARAVGVGSD